MVAPAWEQILTDLADLREQFAEVRRENQALRAEKTQLAQQLAKANERIAELEALVARAKQKPRPKKAPAPPAPAPELSRNQQQAFAERPVLPERVIPEPIQPVPQIPTGRKPLPRHLPEEVTEVCPAQCGHCGSAQLDQMETVVEEKLHVVQEHQRRRVVRRTTVRCRNCLRRTTEASLPAPYERSKVTCDWLAWFVVQKFYLLVPLDRTRRLLALQGVSLSMGTLVGFVDRAAEALAAIDGEHWTQLKAGGWMQSDGTGLQVVVEKKAPAYKGYLEVYSRDELVVFQYEARKDGATLASKLRTFEGIVVMDAESRADALFATGRVREAGCNAHGRRKFEAAEAEQPVLAVEGGRFLTEIFRLEAAAQTAGLEGAALKEWRQTQIGPVYADLKTWCEAVQPTLIESDLLRKAIQYYDNHWKALTLWVEHPELPPDNSRSEREFQTVAKARLSWLFAGSTEGAHRIATLLGVVATARNVGVDPQAYLTWVFERRGTHAGKYGMRAVELTPMAYKAGLARPSG
jgi:hypothetical protein